MPERKYYSFGALSIYPFLLQSKQCASVHNWKLHKILVKPVVNCGSEVWECDGRAKQGIKTA